jgi:nucleoside diphosphate kinase
LLRKIDARIVGTRKLMGVLGLFFYITLYFGVSQWQFSAADAPACGSGINRAFVFVKPNAMRSEAVELVRTMLHDFKINIVDEGSIDAATIDTEMLIDKHYGAIASKAVKYAPGELVLSAKAKDAFASIFHEDFAGAVAAGRVVNAKDACSRLGLTEVELSDKWAALTRGVTLVKFGGGFYCGRVDDVYVINGFYMSMRSMYVKPPASIQWMAVEWSPATSGLSWADFRAKVVGSTDPATAARSSIRAALLEKWQSLGLSSAPSVKENGLHASASPLEALFERMNWLKLSGFEEDPFFAELHAAGVPAARLEQWREDPPVEAWGAGSLFDALEDSDAEDAIKRLAELHRISRK